MSGINIGLAEESAGDGKRHIGRVSSLFYDADSGVFSCMVRHTAGRLAVTTPVVLDPDIRTIKVLSSTIPGWLSGVEMETLFNLARGVPGDKAIVEIGSYQGKSTVCLGWGSRLGNGAPVYAVDPHTGSKEHGPKMQGSMGTLPLFQSNIARANLESFVFPLVMTSEEAVDYVDTTVGLVFVDGDHDLAHQDIELWYDKVMPGGLFAFHDSIGGAWPRVEEDLGAALESGLLIKTQVSGTITVAKKPDRRDICLC